MILLDPWDVAAIAGLLLVLGGAAAVYWPLALILGGGLLLGAYYVRESRNVSESSSPAQAEPGRDERE